MNKGCWVAAITPMFLDGSIDYKAWERLLASFVDAKLAGVVVLGTTAESVNITFDERAKLLDIAAKILSNTQWLVGVGHASMAEAIKLTKQAECYSPTGLMVVTPYYNRPMAAGLVQYFKTLLTTSNLPMIAYNVPTRTGIDVGCEVWDQFLQHENFIGLKEAHSDVKRAEIYRERYPDLLLYSGNDDNIHQWNKLGGDGLISVIANALPSIVNDYTNGGSHPLVTDLLAASAQAVNPVAIKCIMHKLGLCDLGIRLPLAITDEIYNQVEIYLKDVGEVIC